MYFCKLISKFLGIFCVSLLMVSCSDMAQSLHNYALDAQDQQLRDFGFAQSNRSYPYAFNFKPNERQWNLVDRMMNEDHQQTLIFAPAGQNVYNYVESITLNMQSAPSQQYPTAAMFFNNFEAKYRQNCSNLETKVLSRSSKKLIYNMNATCGNSNTMHFLHGKIILKNNIAFLVLYSADQGIVDNSDIASSIKLVDQTTVSPASQP